MKLLHKENLKRHVGEKNRKRWASCEIIQLIAERRKLGNSTDINERLAYLQKFINILEKIKICTISIQSYYIQEQAENTN